MSLRRLAIAPAAALLASNALAGGIEHFCTGSPSAPVEQIEAWLPSLQPNVPWTLRVFGNWVAYGLPNVSCLTGSHADPSEPVTQSFVRAIEAWNAATVPGTAIDASPFAISTVPSVLSIPQQLPSQIANDGINSITLWEHESTFGPSGGPFVLGAAIASVTATGTIVDCDVALNARSVDGPTGKSFFVLLEDNDAYGRVLATRAIGALPGAPPGGWVDLQGLATHEMGHFIGLGHSLVDSTANINASAFPCMFPLAQHDLFFETISHADVGVCNSFTTEFVSGTMLGTSARVPRADDVHALADGYPHAAGNAYGAQLGSIAGTVRTASGNLVQGASVVAVNAPGDETRRVGTLTYLDGQYTISGLPVGSYFLMVEPVDQANPPFTFVGNDGHYFDQFDVPNFVFLGAVPGQVPCVPTPIDFPIEFFNTNDAAADPFPSTATLITVVAGGTVTADVVVGSGNDSLTVKDQSVAAAFRSPRGVRILPLSSGGYPTVDFRVDMGPGRAGRPVEVRFDHLRTYRQIDGQARQVVPPSGGVTVGGIPASILGTLDTNGVFTTTFPFGGANAHQNVFVQAVVDTGSGSAFSNCVNVWVTKP